jgi:hypothetical protein
MGVRPEPLDCLASFLPTARTGDCEDLAIEKSRHGIITPRCIEDLSVTRPPRNGSITSAFLQLRSDRSRKGGGASPALACESVAARLLASQLLDPSVDRRHCDADNYVSGSPPSLERRFSSAALNPSDSQEARERFVATRRAGRAERADRNSARRRCGIDSTGMRGTRPCLRFERKRVEAKSPTNTDIVSLRAPVRSFERTAARRDPEVIIRTRVAVMTRCTLLFQTRVIEPPSTLGSDS